MVAQNTGNSSQRSSRPQTAKSRTQTAQNLAVTGNKNWPKPKPSQEARKLSAKAEGRVTTTSTKVVSGKNRYFRARNWNDAKDS